MTLNHSHTPEKIKIGISSCLLGNVVRYDAKHKRDDLIVEILLPDYELVAFCPEVAIGMGVPRPPMHLVRKPDGRVHALDIQDHQLDFTERLGAYAHQVCDSQLTGICGYIFKTKSPSCGLDSVKIHTQNRDVESRDGKGIFAAVVQKKLPDLPVIDEQMFRNTNCRNAFLQQVKRYHFA